MSNQDEYWYLEDKNLSWSDSATLEEIIKFLCVFRIENVLQFLSRETLRKCVNLTKEKDEAKSATEDKLIEILSNYKADAIYESIKLEELRKLAKRVIEKSYENQRNDLKQKLEKEKETVKKLLLEKNLNKEDSKTPQKIELKSDNKERKPEISVEEMASNDETKFYVFSGKDYSIWKKRLLLFLKLKKCDTPAVREKIDTDNNEDWDDKNIKAMNYIYCNINNEQLEFVTNEDSAFKIIKKFDTMYLKESSALQICIRNKLEKIKLKDYDNSNTFLMTSKRQLTN